MTSATDDWLARYGAALEERLGRAEPGLHLAPEAGARILDLARVVAHGTERKNAPLASFLAGRYVAARTAAGAKLQTAVAEAVEVAEAILAPGE